MGAQPQSHLLLWLARGGSGGSGGSAHSGLLGPLSMQRHLSHFTSSDQRALKVAHTRTGRRER